MDAAFLFITYNATHLLLIIIDLRILELHFDQCPLTFFNHLNLQKTHNNLNSLKIMALILSAIKVK